MSIQSGHDSLPACAALSARSPRCREKDTSGEQIQTVLRRGLSPQGFEARSSADRFLRRRLGDEDGFAEGLAERRAKVSSQAEEEDLRSWEHNK